MNSHTDQECVELLQLANIITKFIEPKRGNDSYRYLGQLLTDFENGPIFKKLVIQREYNGYLFYEHDRNCPMVTTYCFFDSASLSKPLCEQILF